MQTKKKANVLPLNPEVNIVVCHRPPTPVEVKFGEGDTHYRDFPKEMVVTKNGRLKAWLLAKDEGVRYYTR